MKKTRSKILSLLLTGLFSLGLASCEEHVHAFTQQVIVTNPTCTKEGVGYFYCPEDNTRTQDLPIPALGHAEAVKTIAPTCTEKGYDVHYCTRCGEVLGRDNYVEPKGHAYKVTVVPPTCTEEGYSIYECACGDDFHIGDYVDPLGHDYTSRIVAPTCTEPGYTVHECSRCDDHYVDTYTAPLGHDLVHHDGKEPTCDEAGWKEYDTCSRCDYSSYEALPAYGHHYRKTVHAPSCTEAGHTHYQCLVCGEEHDDDPVPALGHAYVEYPAKAATCDEAGHNAYHVCSRCGESNYEEIPPLGGEHEYTEKVIPPTVSSQGYTLHTCTHCGVSYKTDFVAPLPVSSIMGADEAIAAGHMGEDASVLSMRDDDYYYYVIYHGHVSNFIFHSLYDFTWSENMGKLGTYPKEREPAKPMDVLENYQAYQAFWGESIASTLLNSVPLEPKGSFQVLPSTGGDKALAMANTLLQSAGGAGLLEALDPSLAGLSSQIDALDSSYRPGENADFYEEGVEYNYAAVSDLDLFVAVSYDIANETFYYQPCSRLTSGGVREVLLATTSGAYGDIEKDLDVTADASARLDVPTAYETNHPLKTYSFTQGTKIDISIGFDGQINYTLNDAAELYTQGYDEIYIAFSFYCRAGGILSSNGATFYVEINNKDSGNIASKQISITHGNPHTETFATRAVSTLFPEGRIVFRSVWKSGFAYDLTVTANMYLYNSTARTLGAYAGTVVG